MLSLVGGTSHRLGGGSEVVHAPGAVGRRELDLLNQQRDIDTEMTGCLNLAAGFWIPQALNDTRQCIVGEGAQRVHILSLTPSGDPRLLRKRTSSLIV